MFFSDTEQSQIDLIGRLAFANPFSETRTALEKELLGNQYIGSYQVWNAVDGELSVNKNLGRIQSLCDALIQKGLANNSQASFPSALQASWDKLALYWLFSRYSAPMSKNIYLGLEAEAETARLYDQFRQDFLLVFTKRKRKNPLPYAPEDIFAVMHQIHRAFNHIFDFIAGGSIAAGEMRSSIWQSIFSCDLERYYRQLHNGLPPMSTLITGESGTGKELAAQAVAFSQFIPFDARRKRFDEFFRNCFHPVQLSAFPQTLLESELFGHAAGAFTGARHDRAGYFEICQPYASIFLDEIGDTSLETQVKLLRVLQTRHFQRLGDTKPQEFHGKIIAATNANLQEACTQGRFRMDLLFRLCGDTIQTVPLRELIDGRAEELRLFVTTIAKRLLSGEDALSFAQESTQWITKHLGLEYSWPGNVREMEQCLRNLLIRKEYTPLSLGIPTNQLTLDERLCESGLTADELLARLVRGVYKRQGSVLGTANATGLNRRTVKKYLDSDSPRTK